MAALTKGRCLKPGVLAALLVFASLATAEVQDPIRDPGAFLRQTEAVRVTDHPRFLARLKQIQDSNAVLDENDRWHLRYLTAWETMFEGDYAASQKQLRQIVDSSHDAELAAKASALLLQSYGINRQYEKTFDIANRLVAQLPQMPKGEARQMVLGFLSQAFTQAGQPELALKYVRMLMREVPPGESSCSSRTSEATVLSIAGNLAPEGAELTDAIAACEQAGVRVATNALRLIQGERFLAEKRPAKAIAMLDRVAQSIQASGYMPHKISAAAMRAQADEQLGLDQLALRSAKKALALGGRDGVSPWQRDAYGVLYRVAKRQGDTAAALDYYEHYVEQDRGYLDDVSARSLAFQLAKQQMALKELETDGLRKQNSILTLQQALDAKAAETSRLYITLLIILVALIALWLIRSMRLQRRFKKLANHDGLTGILNHQHFMGEAERLLRLAERKGSDLSLVSIDLDHFKQVNDSYGHAMGDEVLKHAVHVCQMQLRGSDLFGRLGGEEFGILLQDCAREEALKIAHCVQQAIGGTPVARDGKTIWISASVGLACTDRSGFALQNLCMDADAALYRAKRAGRNRVMTDAEGSGFALA